MQNYQFNKIICKILLFLFLITLQSYILDAQIRSRDYRDSILAQKNNRWYIPDSLYQFQVAYPKLQAIPPITRDMPIEILYSYIFLDSLMRNVTPGQLKTNYLDRWRKEKIKNDTLIAAVKYLYKLIDYNPIGFYQYMHNQKGSIYKINLITVYSTIHELLDYIISNTPNYFAMADLFKADYILKIHINSINTLPRKEYSKGNFINGYVYQVNATVLDTLKGRVFQNCICDQYLNSKKSENVPLISGSTICFTYHNAPYSNGRRKIDESLLDTDRSYMPRNLVLKPGQDLIVTLQHCNYYWDYDYDYLSLNLLTAIPIINGQVKDNNKEWSNSLLLDYPHWKQEFLIKVNMLLNGGY